MGQNKAGAVSLLNRVVREGLTEEVPCEHSL